MTRYIVRHHEAWMPGQGPRCRYFDTVCDTRDEADAHAARLNAAARETNSGRYAHVIEETMPQPIEPNDITWNRGVL